MIDDLRLRFLVEALAVFRIASMVAREDGPFWMFRKLRQLVKHSAPRPTHMDQGIECPLCISMQAAIAVLICDYFFGDNPLYIAILLVLALSGVSVILFILLPKPK